MAKRNLFRITTIFDMSLGQRELPMNWKNVVVTLIHKIGLTQLSSNYKPVGLINVVDKMLEIIIKRL